MQNEQKQRWRRWHQLGRDLLQRIWQRVELWVQWFRSQPRRRM